MVESKEKIMGLGDIIGKDYSRSSTFNILKDRVKQVGIYIDKDGYAKSGVWTSYRRLYENSDITFSINKAIEEENKVLVHISEGDYTETFETNLYFNKAIPKPGYYSDRVLIKDFKITKEMYNGMNKFGLQITSA